MGTKRFTMRLSQEEERLLSAVAKLTAHTKADLVRSIMFPALESMLANKATAMVDPQDFEKMWTYFSHGKTAKDVEFEKQLLAEEEKFWSK